MKLADVEAQFYALVTARESVAATVSARGREVRRAAEEMVAGDARLPAIPRLEIYADMYFARIHDVLRDEYAEDGGGARRGGVSPSGDRLSRRLPANRPVDARGGGAPA